MPPRIIIKGMKTLRRLKAAGDSLTSGFWNITFEEPSEFNFAPSSFKYVACNINTTEHYTFYEEKNEFLRWLKIVMLQVAMYSGF